MIFIKKIRYETASYKGGLDGVSERNTRSPIAVSVTCCGKARRGNGTVFVTVVVSRFLFLIYLYCISLSSSLFHHHSTDSLDLGFSSSPNLSFHRLCQIGSSFFPPSLFLIPLLISDSLDSHHAFSIASGFEVLLLWYSAG